VSVEQQFRFLPKRAIHHTQSVQGYGGDIAAVWLWLQNDGRPGAIALFRGASSRSRS